MANVYFLIPLSCSRSNLRLLIPRNYVHIICYTTVTIQQECATLCFKCFFSQVHCCHAYSLYPLKLHILTKRRCHLDVLFPINFYLSTESCPSLLENVGFRDPSRYIRKLSMFDICCSSENGPDWCASGAVLFVGPLTYLEPKLFFSIIFYNLYNIIRILIISRINLCIFSPRHGWRDFVSLMVIV
jgi:hypothetical protein